MSLFFASSNPHKAQEVEAILNVKLEHYQKGNAPYVEENGATFFENALVKAKFSQNLLCRPVLCEDSGIVVPSLGGRPGIYSARYSGKESNDEKNRKKLLLDALPFSNRKAYYISVFVYFDGEKVIDAAGILWGTLSFEERGEGGFGYDPIFIPSGHDKTLAELGNEIKNQISHRRKALTLLKKRLRFF